MYKYEDISGHCPKQNQEYSIKVKLISGKTLGNDDVQFKKSSFICPYSEEIHCEYSSKCPLFYNS